MVRKRNRQQGKINNGRLDTSGARRGAGTMKDGGINRLHTFFFTEFPDDFFAKEMWSIFLKYGDVNEVVIPNKRDKRGQRFGFVRFANVRDPATFAVKLDNIIIGRQKLFVNISRFQRDVWEKRSHPATTKVQIHANKQVHIAGTGQTGRSYANAVRQEVPKTTNNDTKKRIINPAKSVFAHLSFKVGDEVVEKLNKAYVGKVSRAGATYTLQEDFFREGYFGIKVTPMGANLTLLESTDEEEIPNLILEAKDWLLERFEDIRAWSPNEIDNERLVWVRCFGIPVHAWTEEFFTLLVAGIGEFTCVDDSTSNRERLDMARIQFRTRVHGFVNELFKVNINGLVFSIKMIEEWYGMQKGSSSSKEMSDYSDSDSFSSEEDGRGGKVPAMGNSTVFGDEDDVPQNNHDDHLINSMNHGQKAANINEPVDENNKRTMEKHPNDDGVHPDLMNENVSEEIRQAVDGNLDIGECGSVSSNDGPENGPNCYHHISVEETSNGSKGSCVQETQVEADANKTSKDGGGPKQNEGAIIVVPQLMTERESTCPQFGNTEENANGGFPPVYPYTISFVAAVGHPTNLQVGRAVDRRKGGMDTTVSYLDSGESENTGIQNNPASANLETESDIQRCNEQYWRRYDGSVAAKIWRGAKELGVLGTKEDSAYEKAIQSMEDRDHKAKVIRGRQNQLP